MTLDETRKSKIGEFRSMTPSRMSLHVKIVSDKNVLMRQLASIRMKALQTPTMDSHVCLNTQ